MLSIDHHGPVEYLVLEFPGDSIGEDALSALAKLSVPGAVRVLDLAFLHKGATGEIHWYEADEADSPDPDASFLFDVDRSDLLNEDELIAAAESLSLGSCGCLVVVENVWESAFEDAVALAHGRVTADERAAREQVAAALRFAADALS